MANQNGQKGDAKVWSAYELALNLGFMIVIPVLIFGVGGVLLDKKLNSFPIFVLVGFVLSMTSGLMIVYVKTKDIIANGTLKVNQPKVKSPKSKKK